MDLTTIVILLVSLTSVIVAGIAVVYKRKRDPDYIKRRNKQQNKPLVHNSESMEGFIGRHLSAVPYAIVLILLLVMLGKCGVV